MTYVVLARKYRPETFADMVGQERTANALKAAIRKERVAHAYLFAGPRGTGKTSMARIYAKALNCPDADDAEPCCKCEVCSSVAAGSDVDVIEIDGASNRGVDDARALRDGVRYGSTRGKYKIYIIDEVHMLTREAFNALLKTLEEPPAHVKFILATTEPEKLLETIHSRVQRFDFRRVGTDAIAKRLAYIAKQESIEVEDGVLRLIARSAAGGLRDSVSLLDQLAAGSGDRITLADVTEALGAVASGDIFKLLRYVADGNTSGTLEFLDTVFSGGAAPETFIDQTVDILRDVLVFRVTAKTDNFVSPGSDAGLVSKLAERFTPETLMLMTGTLVETRQKIRWESRRRVLVEMAFLKLCRIEDLIPTEELMKRFDDIEKRLARLIASPMPAQAQKSGEGGTSQLPFASAPPRAGESGMKTRVPAAEAPEVDAESVGDEKVQRVLDSFNATVVRKKERG
ncbi:MAG: DNA polymerase III subunit gamma/tau [Planctomycetota bacterium]|jgi:DNA polymerase-3 subunit gamma/tau